MKIDLAFITYNRIDYTKLALQSILADPSEEFSLTIWDNASTDGTVEYLKHSINDQRINDITFSKENLGQTAAINAIWHRSQADLLGKLDNDCIVTPGWTHLLAKAHEDIPELGVVAMWHFFEEDFEYERAKHKIQAFGKHLIFRHPWTCGTGFLIKRKAYKQIGPIHEKAMTRFFINVARKGYVNGFLYPLVLQEHMDDPRSAHCLLHKQSFSEAYQHCFGFQTGAISDIDSYKKLHQNILDNLLEDSYNPTYYSPWRKWIRGALNRFFK